MNTTIDYDFKSEENAHKWKGVLTNPLRRVLEQVHPSLVAKDDALEYVEQLCLRLLGLLCAKPSPHTIQDVEYRVQSTFPKPIDKWALKEAQEALERGKKKSVLPVDKIHNLLQKELLSYKIDMAVSLFLVAVLEYISADILKLAGNYVKHIKHDEITFQDVQISMNADKALMDMFYQDEGGGSVCVDASAVVPAAAPRTSLTYEEVVRELMASERQYMRELHMIIRVFREIIVRLNADQKQLDMIFSNVMDIYDLTVTLLGSLEDVMEMAQEQMPYVGTCFEELAEGAEFSVYTKYAHDVTSSGCRETINALLSRPEADQVAKEYANWPGLKLAIKYYLPALLMAPIRHCFTYLEYLKVLIELSQAYEDKEALIQVEGLLKPLFSSLGPKHVFQSLPKNSQFHARARRQAALDKLHELQRTVENWDAKETGQSCSEFVREDFLQKVSSGKRLTTRRVFLFDGLIILCKPNSRRQSSVHHHSSHHPDCKLKERFQIRKVDIVDHGDTDEIKNAFELAPTFQSSIVLCANSADDKNSWMADLVMFNQRSTMERTLDSVLAHIEEKHPLKEPSPQLYKFAEPDSKDNIILEQRENGGVPLIKGATLYKLVERLTYHKYADPKFVRTFLTTYRSFCSPMELLQLLIERFQIPDPSLVYEQQDNANCDDKTQKNSQREDWKRYRTEYCQPVQFRVLNVLRHWVEHHFYDFERDGMLLDTLKIFLDSVSGKSMRKWVDSVLKIVQRKCEPDSQRSIKIAFPEDPPSFEWHITTNEEEFNILTLHPLELARQLTILEFDLYRTIKPSELVGSVWTKKDKEKSSPNLLKMIKHTTNITRWYEKNIVEAQNFDERCAVVNRILEIMTHLDELNNFNGVLAIGSALGSASVFRLKFTFQSISPNNRKALEECRCADDHFKKYQEKLRSINPPCVPFVGMYLTNILHIEEGNPDYLPNTQLINFFKRRKVAEITGEIQQYQNQPYCYNVEPSIRHFLENLNPFPDMNDTEISNYLFNKSIEIEPRGCKQLPKFPRKWPPSVTKSPSTKTKQSRSSVVVPSFPASSTSSSSSNANSTAQQQVQHHHHHHHHHHHATTKSDDSSKEDSSKSDDNTIFATVEIINCSKSPTESSPRSPAPSRWSHSIEPHSPTSPPHHVLEPKSPRLLPSTPPPLPPRRRRDSSDAGSPLQKHHPSVDVPPQLPPRDSEPPPLPPRRAEVPSPGSHHHHAHLHHHQASIPRLNPMTSSQLHIRRHSNLPPTTAAGKQQLQPQLNNGATNNVAPPPPPPTHLHHLQKHQQQQQQQQQPPAVSPRQFNDQSSGQSTPKLPPKPPSARSAGPFSATPLSSGATAATMFPYPSTKNV